MKPLQSLRDCPLASCLGKRCPGRAPPLCPARPRDLCARTRAHTHVPPRSRIYALTNTGTHTEDARAATCTRVHTRAQLCGVWPPASLYQGLVTSKWWVGTSIFCGRRRSPGADKGGRDALGCWTNLRCLCFFPNPLHVFAFPAFPSLLTPLCLLCAFCCLPILLCPRPYLFLLLGLALSPFPNPPCPFRSPVSSPSACSRTRVQLRLRGGQLLPSHWRPSHRPSTKAFGDLDVRAAHTRALLHR